MERVVLIGNCQVQAITNLYKRFASKSAGQILTYIRSYEDISEEGRQAIESADILVEHVQDFAPKANVGGVATRADRIGVPVVNCGFLWPFARQPHPNNPHPPYLEGGPYGAEASDAFLNSLIKKGVDPDEAVKQYLNLDVNGVAKLDRLFEILIENQTRRDTLTGFRITHLIADHFRDEPPFLTPHHPNVRVALALASQFFEKMGVDAADIALMNRAIRVTPFPKEELPVHPAVARHFDLKWATKDRTYSFLSEGGFTFNEYARRYMLCEWNPILQEGIELSRAGQLERAAEKLAHALTIAPQSAEGHGALSNVLDRLGRYDEALVSIAEAIKRNANHAPYRLQYGLLLQREGDVDGAEREIRLAAALDPFDPHYPGMLANFLNRHGYWDEAAAVARHGLINSPRALNLYMEMAYSLDRLGIATESEQAYRKAIDLAPDDARPWTALADSLERRNLPESAIETLQQALERTVDRGGLHASLARLLLARGRDEEANAIWANSLDSSTDDQQGRRQIIGALLQAGNLAAAEAAARDAATRFPNNIGFILDLAFALERSGNLDGALEEVAKTVQRMPGEAELVIRFGELLARQRNFAGAEQALQSAVRLAPANPHALSLLAHILSEQGRNDEAVAMRERAVALDAKNGHRWAQLSHLLGRAGRLDEACRAIEEAIRLEPAVPQFYLDKAHILSLLKRRAEAIEVARYAVVMDPMVSRFHAYLADLLAQNSEDWDAAENTFSESLRLAPNESHVLGQFGLLLARRRKRDKAYAMFEAALRLDPENPWLAEQLKAVSPTAAAAE
jgi:tetratricopeptide (TPR) repeat protein